MSPREVTGIVSPEAWKAFQALGGERVLFKFSPRCPVSFAAEDEYHAWLASLQEEVPFRIARIDVVAQRELARAIAKEVGVPHESPQAIWFDADGKVRWHASHEGVNTEALEALQR